MLTRLVAGLLLSRTGQRVHAGDLHKLPPANARGHLPAESSEKGGVRSGIGGEASAVAIIASRCSRSSPPCPRMLRPAFRTAGRDRCLPMYSPPQPVHDQRSPTATNVHLTATLGFCIRCAGSRSACQGPIASRRFCGVGFTLPMRDVQRAPALTEHEGRVWLLPPRSSPPLTGAF